mmetsp:Transcript_57734/g.172300  ORF Transcript_57734/g.172300 Transcript_57734/m.172300 type:complete len:492 (-) Transcript_57734:773-2248(-)
MFKKGRKFTARGQMSSSGNGPAIQMMPPHIRAMFMPDPPLHHLPPPKRLRPVRYIDPPPLSKEEGGKKDAEEKSKKEEGKDDGKSGAKIKTEDGGAEEKKETGDDGSDDNSTESRDPLRPKLKTSITGLAHLMDQFERTPPPERVVGPTPKSVKSSRARRRSTKAKERLAPVVESYREAQKDSAGEYRGMNCYNTLFVGRLAYEVTERKLLREFEAFGSVKDLKLVTRRDPDTGERKSRGYAFVEYEHEEDMKMAYRRADGIRVEGREVVVDVERGHTVPNWLPRRLGGGLGGTRLGGKDKNVIRPGRYDPSKPDAHRPPMGGGPGGPGGHPMGMGGPGGHPMGMGGPGGGPMGGPPMGGGGRAPPPPGYGGGDRYGGPPPGRGGPPGPGGDYYGGGRAGGGPPPPGYGGGYDRRGPPLGPGGFGGGGPPGGPHGYGAPPPGRGGPPGPGGDYYGGGGGRGGPPPGPPGGGYGRKRGRSRSRSPERRRGRF